VERHTIEIVKFKSSGEIVKELFPGIKTASTEGERSNRIVGGGPYFDPRQAGY
jgi:hypothetical protein